MSDNCNLCLRPAQVYVEQRHMTVMCHFCGTYVLFYPASEQALYNGIERTRVHLYSGAVRELSDRNGDSVKINDFDDLLSLVSVPKSPLEQIDRLLMYIASKSQYLHQGILYEENLYPVVYAKNVEELHWLVRTAKEIGYMPTGGTIGDRLVLNATGWNRAEELSKLRADSDQAFVAMWFSPAMYEFWEKGFAPALKKVGYNPIRVDTKESNGKVDDKIVADIRKSGLVVADFTGQRGGVYFEAGFALGLGLPVIFTCREDDLKNVHFDTRQYNHIVWADAADLKMKLINRIEATLPNRPHRKP